MTNPADLPSSDLPVPEREVPAASEGPAPADEDGESIELTARVELALASDEPAAAPPPPVTAPAEEALTEAALPGYMPILRNYLRRFVRSNEVEDALQTVLARALENLDRYRGESSARVWLFGIARNVGFEVARARRRRAVSVDDTPETSGSFSLVPSSTETHEEVLGNRQEQAIMLRALDTLSLDEKLVLLVTYADNIAGPEAAELLGITFTAFRQRLSRARQALQKAVQKLVDSGARPGAEALADWQLLFQPKVIERRPSEDPAPDEPGRPTGGRDDSEP